MHEEPEARDRAPGDESPDDWFGAGGEGAPRGDFDDTFVAPAERHVDDWLEAGPADPGPAAGIVALWNRLTPPQQLLTVVVTLGAVLLIGLAAAGVFSGSSKPSLPPVVIPAPVTTFPPAATTTAPIVTTTPTTTAAAAGGVLKPGDKGPAVKRLQERLIANGYGIGTADGSYGPATTRAVSSFQASSGLTADGVAGPATLKALKLTG